MTECYLKNCQYHQQDEPFCKMDQCLKTLDQVVQLRNEKQKIDLDQLIRETCEELITAKY